MLSELLQLTDTAIHSVVGSHRVQDQVLNLSASKKEVLHTS